MRKVRRLFIGITICLHANAFADIEPPKLISWKIEPESIDTSASAAQVIVTFRVTDNDSGAEMPSVTASHDSSGQSTGFATVQRVSGDALDGTYEATLTIPQGSAPGAWEVSLFPLNDKQGNSGFFGPGSEFSAEFVVQDSEGADSEPPKLISWKIEPESIDTSASAAQVIVTFRVTDNDSGAEMPSVTASHDSSGQSTGFATVQRVSGDALDGTYEATLTIPQGSAPGAWEVSLFPLNDKQGNSGFFGPGSEFSAEFVVQDSEGADSEPPKLISWKIEPESIDTSASAAQVIVTFRVTDNDSGAEMPSVTASHDSSGQSTGFATVQRVSGDALDGTYEATLTIPQGSAPGAWEVSLFPLNDKQGNSGFFGPGSEFSAEFVVQESIVTSGSENEGPTSGVPIALLIVSGSSFDFDKDGLTREQEFEYGTNWRQSDSDGDGLSDGKEVALASNPLSTDSDGDGLSDSREVELGTSPILADTDGDSMSDAEEIREGLSPTDGSDCPRWHCGGLNLPAIIRIGTN